MAPNSQSRRRILLRFQQISLMFTSRLNVTQPRRNQRRSARGSAMATRRKPSYFRHIASTSAFVMVGVRLRRKIELVLWSSRTELFSRTKSITGTLAAASSSCFFFAAAAAASCASCCAFSSSSFFSSSFSASKKSCSTSFVFSTLFASSACFAFSNFLAYSSSSSSSSSDSLELDEEASDPEADPSFFFFPSSSLPFSSSSSSSTSSFSFSFSFSSSSFSFSSSSFSTSSFPSSISFDFSSISSSSSSAAASFSFAFFICSSQSSSSSSCTSFLIFTTTSFFFSSSFATAEVTPASSLITRGIFGGGSSMIFTGVGIVCTSSTCKSASVPPSSFITTVSRSLRSLSVHDKSILRSAIISFSINSMKTSMRFLRNPTCSSCLFIKSSGWYFSLNHSSSLCATKNSLSCCRLNSSLYSLYLAMASESEIASSCVARNCFSVIIHGCVCMSGFGAESRAMPMEPPYG
uniref:Uncharacterized protein n=1 Tax=Lutzomyia longipalpis TaxID=7200 RepID=A0A7G3B737_LUTLO